MNTASLNDVFVIVLDKTGRFIEYYLNFLRKIGASFIIISGAKHQDGTVIYRDPRGKYDVINYSLKFIPNNASIVIFLDADVIEPPIEECVRVFRENGLDLAFPALEILDNTRQRLFTRILDEIRRHLSLITANGEMMIIKADKLPYLLPLPPCKAEDTLLLFRALERGFRVEFLSNIHVKTIRPYYTLVDEELYKRRVTCGIYQALSMVKHLPALIRIFYKVLPLLSPLLIVLERTGISFAKGIIRGYCDYLLGDRSGAY